MSFHINRRLFEKYPGLMIGVVLCKGLDNHGTSDEVSALTRQEEAKIRQRHASDDIEQLPKISIWRQAYSDFGAKPKENRSSVENLYKLVLRGVALRHINKLVDIYNLVSFKYMLPVGGEDLDKIKGDVELTYASDSEPSVLLLGDKEPRSPHPGEVIYKDEVSAICRRWNWREADRTKLTEDTTRCLLVIEALPPVTRAEIEAATEELKSLVQRHCGGYFLHAILDINCRIIEI